MKNAWSIPYFHIENALGGRQDWFWDPLMHMGGCAAVTLCDLSIYLARYYGRKSLFPTGDPHNLTRRSFLKLGYHIKPYLRPRTRGIDRLEIYLDGAGRYLGDHAAADIHLSGVPGELPADEAFSAITATLDRNLPVPFLLLRHQDPAFDHLTWHWFMLAGWRGRYVRIITYGAEQWQPFDRLWDTGHRHVGGAILTELPRRF